MTENTRPTVTLNVSTSKEVKQDVLEIVFGYTKTGSTASEVQTALNDNLTQALAVANQVKKGNAVRVKTGDFQTSPVYNKKGEITGWSGRVTLVVYGTDNVTISELVPNITTMTILRTTNSVSKRLRDKMQTKIADEAIKAFMQASQEHAVSFGYNSFKVETVRVSKSNNYNRISSVRMLSAMPASVESAAPLANEPDTEEVGVDVSGSIYLENV